MQIVSLSTDAEFVLVDQIIIDILNCHIIRWLQSHCHRSVTSYPPLFLSPLPSFHCLVLGEKHNDVTMQAFVLSFRVYISQKLPPPCFFLACKDFGRMFNHSIPACVFFFFLFFEVEISSCTLISFFRPGSVHRGTVATTKSWKTTNSVNFFFTLLH